MLATASPDWMEMASAKDMPYLRALHACDGWHMQRQHAPSFGTFLSGLGEKISRMLPLSLLGFNVPPAPMVQPVVILASCSCPYVSPKLIGFCHKCMVYIASLLQLRS